MSVTAVAAIIPAHNEAATIGPVVAVARASGFFREVIVVSDGSTDATAQAARDAGATLVHELPRNRGKSFALSHGVMHTDAHIICFLDADLRGLSAHHLEALLDPVLSGERSLNVVSGQRALHREVFDAIPNRFLQGHGVAVALRYFCRVNELPHSVTAHSGLRRQSAFTKLGFVGGLAHVARSWAESFVAAVRVRLARRQFVEHGTHMSHKHR